MALKKCKECGAEISTSAEVCPSCGKRLKKKHPILGGFLLVFGIMIILASTAGNVQTTPTNSTDTNVIVSRENYDKIEEGMKMDEVKAILGEPTMTSEVELSGTKTILHHYQLPLTTTAIEIYYSNGTVFMKNYVEL